MAQKSLFDLGFAGTKRGQENDSETVCTPSKRTKTDSESDVNTPKSKIKRKFREEWLQEFKWLEMRVVDGQTKLFCTWCRAAKKNNPYANGGSSNLQHSAIDRHQNKNPDHLELSNARELIMSKKTTKDALEIQEAKQTFQSSASKEAQMRTAFFVAKNNLPLRTHNKLIQLQRENGCEVLQDKSTLYTSNDSHEQMIDAINDHISDLVKADILSSDFVGVIVDETTDITIHKKLNIYFKCFKANSTDTVIHFVDCVSVKDGKAETLVNAILGQCSKLGLDMLKLVSMASDGAKVMTGHKGGVGALLRKKNPRLIQVHCVAHRLALCAGQACKEQQAFSDYHNTVKTVYRYFHNSAVRYNTLREMENVLNDDNGDTHTTLKEPASFRWLSLEAAVKAIYRVYPALILALESEAATGSADAKGILKKVKNVAFILRTGFLIDVLECVNKLCKVFQKDDLNVDTVMTQVASTKDTVESYKIKDGQVLSNVYKSLQDGQYMNVDINDTPLLRQGFKSSSQSYIDNLVENIDNRFEEESMDKLTIVNNILNPNKLPETSSAIIMYGEEDIESVTSWLGPVNEYPGLIDIERMKQDHTQFKMTLKNMRGKSLSTVCKTIISDFSETYPDYAILASYMLTAPLTSVACERGFSTQNRLKTKARSRTSHEKVAKLIRIVEEGDMIENFPAAAIVQRFDQLRKRRK